MLILEMNPSAQPALAAKVHSLQRVAYLEESKLIGDDRIPPLHESISELRSQPLRWFCAFADSAGDPAVGVDPLGVIAWETDGDRVAIDRLMVQKGAQRGGVATKLVQTVVRHGAGRPVLVSTGKANAPARALYERLGFISTGNREVLPGLWVSDFELRGSL